MADQPPTDQRERELKFDVPADWTLPNLKSLVPSNGSVQLEDQQLETTYYDTAARDLLGAGLTLRRRTGDADTGWHLKVPDGDARTEIRLPLGGRGVPEPLRSMTLGVRGGAALRPVAILRTARSVHRVLDAEGLAQLEIVVDEVTATQTGAAAVIRSWREVEVELMHADERGLARAARLLEKSGAEPSRTDSKLARALGQDPRESANTKTLGGLIQTYLDAQYEQIVRGDVDLRRGRDAIHATRVATRRYRSTVRIFTDALDADRAAAVDAELKWFAAAMGEVRDRQVLRGHLDAALAELPPELVLGPVADRIHRTLTAEQRQAEADLEQLMRSRRYFALFHELREWHQRPPAEADRPAGDAKVFLRGAERKVGRRLKQAKRAADPDVAMHRVRKAAKRARYAAELSEPALGKPARKATKRAKRIQQRLGDRQDRVVAAQFLRRIAGATAASKAENGFTYGLLYERELARAHRTTA